MNLEQAKETIIRLSDGFIGEKMKSLVNRMYKGSKNVIVLKK